MTDQRTAREREHDRFIAEANEVLARLPLAPTDDVLDRIVAADPHLYGRLVKGDAWINEKLNDHLAGQLADLDDARAGWSDWLRLYRHAVSIIENGDQRHRPPDATTSKPGPISKERNHE